MQDRGPRAGGIGRWVAGQVVRVVWLSGEPEPKR